MEVNIMKSRTLNILRGIGSVLDIMPERKSVDASRLRFDGDQLGIMDKSWNQVWSSLGSAMGEVGKSGKRKSK